MFPPSPVWRKVKKFPRLYFWGCCICSRREWRVPPLTQEQLEQFRKFIASIDVPDEKRDEIIRIVDSIAVSFVDQAFGLDPTTLSLSARANFSFLGVGENAKECTDFKKENSNHALEGSGEDITPESP